MTYEASTFLYAIAVAIFALGGMVGGFTGGWIANKSGRVVPESVYLPIKNTCSIKIFQLHILISRTTSISTYVEEILLIFYYSRKGGLLINNIVGILGAAAMGFAKFAESYELLIMGRFLIGVNCGE